MVQSAGQVPILFKGAGPGTHWHINNPQLSGFTVAARPHSRNAIATHVGAYSHPSGYLSVSTSFAIARRYALSGPGGRAVQGNPGYVYELDLSILSNGLKLLNPVEEIASLAGWPLAHAHNGGPELLREVALNLNPSGALQLGGQIAVPAVSNWLKVLIFAIRDAEVLVHGAIPAAAIVGRHAVY